MKTILFVIFSLISKEIYTQRINTCNIVCNFVQGNALCASDNIAYSSLCFARCVNPGKIITPRFECSSTVITTC